MQAVMMWSAQKISSIHETGLTVHSPNFELREGWLSSCCLIQMGVYLGCLSVYEHACAALGCWLVLVVVGAPGIIITAMHFHIHNEQCHSLAFMYLEDALVQSNLQCYQGLWMRSKAPCPRWHGELTSAGFQTPVSCQQQYYPLN